MCILLRIVLVHFILRLMQITITQYSSKLCVVFLFLEFDRDTGGFSLNRTACCLCCKFYDSGVVLHNTVLSSPLLMRNITPPPILHQHSRKDDSYCGHLIVGLLGIFCYT